MSPSEPDPWDDGMPPEGGRRRADRRRVRRPAKWFLIGVAVAVAVGIGTILTVTQTERGRAEVLAFTLRTLGGRLNGILQVGDLDGNLITGARLYDIALLGPDSVPLALVDSAYIRYRVATFLGGDVVITRLDVYNADISIFRLPGDTLWNYEVILQDPTPSPTGAAASATLVERLFAHELHVEVAAPVSPDPRLPPERQEQQIAEVLADTVRNVLEEVPGGVLRRSFVDVAAAEVAELYIGGEERGGIYLEVNEAVGEVRLWREPPLRINGLTAQMHLNGGMLDYQAQRVVLPNSEGQSVGRVDLTQGMPRYDLVIVSPRFAFSDLAWLYPWLPEDPAAGGGSIRLWLQDRDDGLMVVARDADVTLPDTHITGSFGMISDVVTETISFVDVDLEAEPLRVESVEALLPQDVPIEGLVIGGATVRGQS